MKSALLVQAFWAGGGGVGGKNPEFVSGYHHIIQRKKIWNMETPKSQNSSLGIRNVFGDDYPYAPVWFSSTKHVFLLAE